MSVSEKNDKQNEQYTRMWIGDRLLISIFLMFILPVFGGMIIYIQRLSVNSVIGWIAKWCLAEFFVISFVFLFFLFLWAIFQTQWLEKYLFKATARVAVLLAVFLCITILLNIIMWILNMFIGWY